MPELAEWRRNGMLAGEDGGVEGLNESINLGPGTVEELAVVGRGASYPVKYMMHRKGDFLAASRAMPGEMKQSTIVRIDQRKRMFAVGGKAARGLRKVGGNLWWLSPITYMCDF